MIKKEKNALVLPLKKYFEKIGENIPLTDFKIKGGLIDVINYNKEDKVFDIAECKIANNLVKIGQAFGQVLAYYCIIADNGRSFFKRVLDQAKIFTEKKTKIRLFVCFQQEGIKNNSNILDNFVKGFKERIGVIAIYNGEVKTIREASEVIVPIRASYNKEEFYEKLKEDITDKIDKIRYQGYAGLLKVAQFYFARSGLHFEVWIRKKQGNFNPIEIGLHLESNNYNRNKRIYEELQKRKRGIKKRLPKAEFERWGKRVKWYRIYEEYPYNGAINRIDERTLKTIENKLLNYIRVLKPILDEINWGKRRGTKRHNTPRRGGV